MDKQTKKIGATTTVTTAADSLFVPVVDGSSNVNKITVANLRKVINQNQNLNALEDGIFIFALTNDTSSYRRLVKPSKWASYKNSCTAIGIAVQSGDKMIIVAINELSCRWSTAAVAGGGYTNSNRKLAIRDWAGEANTTAQIAHAECSPTSVAPGYCHNYSRLNPYGQGIPAGHWWLPSLGELLLIYANMEKINYVLSLIDGATQLTETNYWSSSENSSSGTWCIEFVTGYVYSGGNKAAGNFRARPVAAFE